MLGTLVLLGLVIWFLKVEKDILSFENRRTRKVDQGVPNVPEMQTRANTHELPGQEIPHELDGSEIGPSVRVS